MENWIYNSVIRTVLCAIFMIIQKYQGTTSLLFPNMLSIFIGIISATNLALYNDFSELSLSLIIKVAISAIITFFIIIHTYYAIRQAPNAALVRAFVGLEIVLLAIFSYFLYGTEITPSQFIGIIFILLGLYLLI